jgi:hypothetical protein
LNLSGLTQLLADLPAYRQLLEETRAGQLDRAPLALHGAARAFVVAGMIPALARPTLYLVARSEHARQAMEELRVWLAPTGGAASAALSMTGTGAVPLHSLADPDALPYERVAWSRETRQARLGSADRAGAAQRRGQRPALVGGLGAQPDAEDHAPARAAAGAEDAAHRPDDRPGRDVDPLAGAGLSQRCRGGGGWPALAARRHRGHLATESGLAGAHRAVRRRDRQPAPLRPHHTAHPARGAQPGRGVDRPGQRGHAALRRGQPGAARRAGQIHPAPARPPRAGRAAPPVAGGHGFSRSGMVHPLSLLSARQLAGLPAAGRAGGGG